MKKNLLPHRLFRSGSGMTLVEMIVVLFIMGTLTGLVTINLSSLQTKSYLTTAVDTLVADFKEQQIKSMVGDTDGSSASSAYGVYFTGDSYTLFPDTYAAGNIRNRVINLDGNLQFANSGTIIFAKISGEVSSYNPAANTIVVQDNSTNTQKTIQFNKYGVITSIN